MNLETLEKIRKDVHSNQIKISDYYYDRTNCYSYAIGTPEYVAIGELSGNPNNYFSTSRVTELFLEDMKAVNLEVEEIPIVTLSLFMKSISEIYLRPNQHIVVLFVKSVNNHILDFHFIRYDEKGWSEKYQHRNIQFFNDIYDSWPKGFYTSIGAYVISK